MYIIGGWLLPGRKRVVPYSIQTLERLKPAWFREDLISLLDLLKQKKLKPLVAMRFPFAEARQAHEMLVKGGVIGKIVLVPDTAKKRALKPVSPTTKRSTAQAVQAWQLSGWRP
jgi:NADPH2:quinone reductase